MIGAGLATLLLAALLLVAVSRAALRPLDRLTALAKDITTGDRGRRLARPERTDTELGRAASAFDGMLDALEDSERNAQQAAAAAQRAEHADPDNSSSTPRMSCAPRSPAFTPRPSNSPSMTQIPAARWPVSARQSVAVRRAAAPGAWSLTCWI